MEKKLLLIESALNTILNINIPIEIRLQELVKIEVYSQGLTKLPGDKADTLKAVIKAIKIELNNTSVSEECIGGYYKILKEMLCIGRSLKNHKCIVFGNNWLAEEIESKMRSKNYCVFNWNSVNPEYINEYDIYILCDELLKSYDIFAIANKDRIIKLWDYLKYKFVVFPSFYKTYDTFLKESSDKVKCVVTGNTNIAHAVRTNLLHVKSISLANRSQDIFYDFKMFCHACESLPNVAYAVIGLEPYSLRYDASKSKVEWRRSLVYYPIVKTMHNCEDQEQLAELFEAEDRKIKKFFDEEYMQSLYGLFEEQTEREKSSDEDIFDESLRTQECTALNIREISELFNRPYTDILLENKVILEGYVRFCQRKEIKPVFFIPPYTKWYKDHMKKSYYEELIGTVKMLCSKYNAQLVDMMDVAVPDCCFKDYANMNKIGAVKAASHLNKILEK